LLQSPYRDLFKGQGKVRRCSHTYLAIEHTTVYLLTIYDKSEQAGISRKDLANLREMIP